MNDVRTPVPPINSLKQQAKRLRAELTESGMAINHSKSLEMLAHQYGFRDWNNLNAAAPTNSLLATLRIGQSVHGAYLGQDFVGEIVGLSKFISGNMYRLSLELDEPVDVVTFESFSSLRKRINCSVDEGGISREKTSNGQPQMVLRGVS